MYLITIGEAGIKYKWEWHRVNLMDEREISISAKVRPVAGDPRVFVKLTLTTKSLIRSPQQFVSQA